MSGRLRLFFDECCSVRLAREIGAFYRNDYPQLEIMHLFEKWPAGTADPQWLEYIRENPDWVIITKDAGAKSTHNKLPMICREWGITHVVFTSGLIQKGFLAQKNALVGVWEQLFYLKHLPPGTQVKLGESRKRGQIDGYDLRVGGTSLAAALEKIRNAGA